MAQMTVNFYSFTLGHGVDISVTIPSFTSCDRDPNAEWTHKFPDKFPVLYLLHGGGNDYKCWLRYTSVERLAEERRIAIVTLNGLNSAYNNIPGGERYYDFVSQELPDFITSVFPISASPKDTYIAGLSMGGYGTLVHAFTNPGHYRAYGAFSPGFSLRDMRNDQGELRFPYAIEPCDEAAARMAEGVALPTGYICCGRQDFLYERAEAAIEQLKALGVEFTWHPMDGYEHEWRYWDIEIENFLQWIPRTDFYADKPHKV